MTQGSNPVSAGADALPLEPACIHGRLVFALWSLPRSMRPVVARLEDRAGSNPEAVIDRDAVFCFVWP